jgi:hypothetical protein
MPTEHLISFFENKLTHFNKLSMAKAMQLASELFV